MIEFGDGEQGFDQSAVKMVSDLSFTLHCGESCLDRGTLD